MNPCPAQRICTVPRMHQRYINIYTALKVIWSYQMFSAGSKIIIRQVSVRHVTCSSLNSSASLLFALCSLSFISLTTRRRWGSAIAWRQPGCPGNRSVWQHHIVGAWLCWDLSREVWVMWFSSHWVPISPHSQTASAEWTSVSVYLTAFSRWLADEDVCRLPAMSTYSSFGLFRGWNCGFSTQSAW